MKITRKYKYRRNLPHIEKNDRAHFVTFVTADRWVLPEEAREIVLRSCLHDHEKKLFLHVIVVMPDHVHMIFEPLRDAEGYVFTLAEILNRLKEYRHTASTNCSVVGVTSGKTNLLIMFFAPTKNLSPRSNTLELIR